MKQKNLTKSINVEISKGRLPLGYFNSQIVEMGNKISPRNEINKKYAQRTIPGGNCEFLISKIYEIF